MSELINSPESRLTQLVKFARGMALGENGTQLYEQYRSVTETVSPHETMEVLDVLLREGMGIDIRRFVEKEYK